MLAWRGNRGFFDIDEREPRVVLKGDDLDRLKRLVDFELFSRRPQGGCSSRGSMKRGGRPPFDYVLMFKVWIRVAGSAWCGGVDFIPAFGDKNHVSIDAAMN